MVVLVSMISVQLYKPGRIDITLELPQDWDELLPAELELIAGLMQSDIQDDVKRRAVLLTGLLKARGRKQKIKVPDNIIDLLDPEQVVVEVLPMFDWIFNSNRLTQQPYSSIPLPGLRSTTVYGPLSDFDNLTCGEYEDAETFFLDLMIRAAWKPWLNWRLYCTGLKMCPT